MPTYAEMNTGPPMVLIDSKLEWDPHDVEMADNRPHGYNAVQVNDTRTGDKR